MSRMRMLSLCVVVAMATNSVLWAEEKSAMFSLRKDPAGVEATLVVGVPKLFDFRDLEIILEDLEGQLKHSKAIDSAKLSAAIGTLQGSQVRSVQTGVEFKPLPTPGSSLTESRETTGVGTEAEATKTSQESKTQSAEFAPGPPALAASSSSLPVSNFGISAEDLLTRQLDLQYQIANVQMLLQRAVSDRLYDGGQVGTSQNREPSGRLIAVVGFQVTLSPKIQQRSMAAQVEIEIVHEGKRRPSLVSLMPQQKTYNAAALKKSSSAFGAIAPVGAFTLGASLSSSSETFFLYQDADTYAFELPSTATATRFGWQFRPVLGQTSVTPGVRQLFAVLALDARDFEDERSPGIGLSVTARTHWLNYSSGKRLAKGQPRFKVTSYEEEAFLVPPTALVHRGLAPRIAEATLETIGNGKAVVQVHGENFSHDTGVTVGDKTLLASSVIVRSNNQLQFIAPVSDILRGETVVTGGRYGFSALVREARVEPRKRNCGDGSAPDQLTGFIIQSFSRGGSRKGDLVDLNVVLGPHPPFSGKPNLLGRSVFLEFGGEVYEVPANRWGDCSKTTCGLETPSHITASVSVPFKLFESNQRLLATVPFLGENYRSESHYSPPFGITQLVVLEPGDEKKPAVWGLVGFGIDCTMAAALRVYAGKEYSFGAESACTNPHLLRLTAPRNELIATKEVVVIVPGLMEPKIFRNPMQPAPKGTPKVSEQPAAPKGSSGSVVFPGENLDRIVRVEFSGQALRYQGGKDKELTVLLTREVTKEAGPVTLVGFVDESTFISLNLIIK